MRFVETLIPLKLYSANRRVYIPFDMKDKKKGAAILLLGKEEASITKLMNLPYMYDPGYFQSLYIQRDVNAYITAENTIVDSNREFISDILNEGFTHKASKGLNVVFDKSANEYDKAAISKIINKSYLKDMGEVLGIKFKDEITVKVYWTQEDYTREAPEAFKNTYGYTANNTIHVISKYTYNEITMDGPYEMYLAHECLMAIILSINPSINRTLAEYIAGYLCNQHTLDPKIYKSIKSKIDGCNAIARIAGNNYDFTKINSIIRKNDYKFVIKYCSQAAGNRLLKNLTGLGESVNSNIDEASAVIINDPLKHNYWYHLEPKDKDVSNGLHSIYYYKKNKMETDLNNALDHYRDLLCGKWGVYQHKYPRTLTTDEIIDGIKQVRGPHGDKMIHFFKFPSKTLLTDNIEDLLSNYDLYRIELSSIKEEDIVAMQSRSADDYMGKDFGKSMIDITIDPTISHSLLSCIDTDAVNSFESMGIAMKDGSIDPKYFEKVEYYKNIATLTESVDYTEFKDIKTFSNWMKSNIKYKQFSKLMTVDEVYSSKTGSCHDQVIFELDYLKKYAKKQSLIDSYGAFFMMEYNETNPGNSAETHALVYYESNGKCYWLENAWGPKAGIHEFKSLKDFTTSLVDIHNKGIWGNHNRYPDIIITKFKGTPGMTLQELVDVNLDSDSIIEGNIEAPNVPTEQMIRFNEIGYMSTPNYFRTLDEEGKTGSIFFFEALTPPDPESYDNKLKRYLYRERIKNNKEIMAIYADLRVKNPNIKFMYSKLQMYQRKNVYLDLSYYHGLFLKNNLLKMDKGLYMYWDFLNRLMEVSPEVGAVYTKRTVFIPIDPEDWGLENVQDMFNFKINLNPISAIVRLAIINPLMLKTWANQPIVFCSKRGFFKLDFNTFAKKDVARFRSFIIKLASGEEIKDDPNDVDDDVPEEESEKKGVVVNIIAKVDKKTVIDDVTTPADKKDTTEANAPKISTKLDDVADLELVKSKLKLNTGKSVISTSISNRSFKNSVKIKM